MANVLNFKLTLEDLLGPKVASAIQRVTQLGQQVDKPHKLNIDTSQANGALSGVMGLVGKLGLAAAFATGAKAIVGMGTQMEQTRIQFETFTGSAEKGNAVIGQLQKFANLTPFDDEQVISAGRQLLAFGEDATSLNPILTKLGNISSATGKDFGELVSIYGKNKLSGIIQGEDLNQLNDSGIPVMKSLAAQLGVNVSQVRKMGEQGKITFAMLDKSFDELGGAGGKWGDLMDKQSQTVAGRWSSLVGFAQNLGGKMGEAVNPFIGRIVDGGNELLLFIQKNTDKIKEMFQPAVTAMEPLFEAFDRIRQQLFGNADAGSILTTVFNGLANVIRLLAPVLRIAATLAGKVVTVVWDLIKGIAKFIQTHEWIQKYYAAIWGGAVAAFKGIADAAGKFLGGTGKILEGLMTMNWSKLKEGFSETMSSLADGPKVGGDIASGVVKGWKEGIKPIKLFGDDKPMGTDAASTFLNKQAGRAQGKAPALTAAASAGGVAGVGGKGITNIYLTVNRPFENTTITAGTQQQAAKQTADMFRDFFMAELNDVNTLASN
ncbi:tape measure protein [Hymenobacter negativus]|uniref:Tape measure protein n=1 Tax=Hymenobacter negativus TaxID=2795026 RepID=A0ABS3QDT0_9BACT|nr:tape measure protein [Hymenobacter negativus]MBO2009168.1 tape measure protein [Hymenobacter negativus]